MKRFGFAFLLFSVFAISCLRSQTMPKTHSEASFGKLEYGFYVPENIDKTKSYPLVMFLHGWSANQTVYLELYNKDMQAKHPCFVFTPRTPTTWADYACCDANRSVHFASIQGHRLDGLQCVANGFAGPSRSRAVQYQVSRDRTGPHIIRNTPAFSFFLQRYRVRINDPGNRHPDCRLRRAGVGQL